MAKYTNVWKSLEDAFVKKQAVFNESTPNADIGSN